MGDDDRLAFDADVAGVQGLMPQRLIDATSRPNTVQVEGYIEAVADRLIAIYGDPAGWPAAYPDGSRPDLRDELVEAGRDIVHLRAAARALDAGVPERIVSDDERRQAAVWRAEADAAEAELKATLLAAGYAVVAEAGDAIRVKHAAHTFPPEPLFTRAIRW